MQNYLGRILGLACAGYDHSAAWLGRDSKSPGLPTHFERERRAHYGVAGMWTVEAPFRTSSRANGVSQGLLRLVSKFFAKEKVELTMKTRALPEALNILGVDGLSGILSDICMSSPDRPCRTADNAGTLSAGILLEAIR